jgi:hypothetical protein
MGTNRTEEYDMFFRKEEDKVFIESRDKELGEYFSLKDEIEVKLRFIECAEGASEA